MSDSLDQIRAKISWARARTDELDVLTKTFLQTDFYTISLKQNKDGCLVGRFGEVAPFPVECSLLIGEIAHQLRSALDHLIFALARPENVRQEQFIKFPLCSTAQRFKAQKSSALFGTPRGVLSLVESVQPYHRRKLPDTRFLGQLQAIHNWDKHRALTIASAVIAEANIELEITGSTSIKTLETFGGRIESDKIVFRILPGNSKVGAKIDYYPNFGIYPAFDKGMPREIEEIGVRGILGGAGCFIEEHIIPRFERFF